MYCNTGNPKAHVFLGTSHKGKGRDRVRSWEKKIRGWEDEYSFLRTIGAMECQSEHCNVP